VSDPSIPLASSGFDSSARRIFVNAIREVLGLEPLEDKTAVLLRGDARAREMSRRGYEASKAKGFR
jgi:hypothetical protein